MAAHAHMAPRRSARLICSMMAHRPLMARMTPRQRSATRSSRSARRRSMARRCVMACCRLMARRCAMARRRRMTRCPVTTRSITAAHLICAATALTHYASVCSAHMKRATAHGLTACLMTAYLMNRVVTSPHSMAALSTARVRLGRLYWRRSPAGACLRSKGGVRTPRQDHLAYHCVVGSMVVSSTWSALTRLACGISEVVALGPRSKGGMWTRPRRLVLSKAAAHLACAHSQNCLAQIYANHGGVT